MKVFITGGTGFIGTYIVAELLKRGDEVTLLARNPPNFLAKNVTFVHGGMDDIDLIRRTLDGQDAVVHNAIYWEDESTELELKDSRTSVQLFEAAASVRVKHLVYTSSVAVHRPFRPFMDESTPIAPADFYGATKAANEVFLSAFAHQTSMRCTVIRPGPTVGAPGTEGAPVKVDRKIKEIVELAIRGEDIPVVRGDARQFIGVGDLGKVYAAVLDQPPLNGMEVYLALSHEPTTYDSVARMAVEITGSNSKVLVQDSAWEPHYFDASKLERAFGFRFDSGDSLRETIEALHRQTRK